MGRREGDIGTEDTIKVRVQIRRALVFSVRICYRSVCNHPFLAGLVCFLAILYRSFPLLFSLLVTASPVLVCTAVLLGTLLSFGEANLPEIEVDREREGEEEEEEEISHEISSLKVGSVGDANVVARREESFGLENLTGKRKDLAGKAVEEEGLTEDEVNKVGEDDYFGDYEPLVDESSREIRLEKGMIEETAEQLDNVLSTNNKEVAEEKLENKEEFDHGQVSGEENGDLEDGISPGEFVSAQKEDHLDDSSWKRVNDDDEGEEEVNEVASESESESDGAESSSPDASMADIIPMLDELHPLLEVEVQQPASRSPEGTDASSGRSDISKVSSIASDDSENQVDEEEDGDTEHDNEEEEDVQEGKEDESKSAIKWTEDDQKNLMDLGSLELERNQRLEHLIARRRARRNMRLMAEKNLIDLDSADLPVNIPPISTTRQNPFDLPYDPYDDVPGSAPSVLLPRRNPFDLPYDSSEEKPDLKGDTFQQEFTAPQHREAVFRRHESFSVGPSVLGFPRQEKQELRWKPYFVPERFAGEGTSYSTLQRQLSEVSESKMSSVLDTESVSSAVEEEDKKLSEEDISHEAEMTHIEDHASILVEHGSLTFEDVDSIDVEEVEQRHISHDEVELTLGDTENPQEMDSTLSASEVLNPVELNANEILLRMGPAEEDYSSESSISSLVDTDEAISSTNHGSPMLEQKNNQEKSDGQSMLGSEFNIVSNQITDFKVSKQASPDSQFHYVNGEASDHQHNVSVMQSMANHNGKSGFLTQTDLPVNIGVSDPNLPEQPALKTLSEHASDSGISKQPSLESKPHFLREAEEENQHEVMEYLEAGSNHDEKSGLLKQSPLELDVHVTGTVMDNSHHKGPVYDSSPPSIDRFLPFSSVSSDTLGEIVDASSPPALVETVDMSSEVHLENREDRSSDYKEMLQGYPQVGSQIEIESRSREAAEIGENDVLKQESEGVDLYHDSQNGSRATETEVEHASVDLPPLVANNETLNKGGLAYKEGSFFHEGDQIYSSHGPVVDKLDSTSCDHHMDSEVTSSPSLEVQHFENEKVHSSGLDIRTHVNGSKVVELDVVAPIAELMASEEAFEAQLDVSSSETKDGETNLSREEEAFHLENNQAHLSNSNADVVQQDVYKEVVSSECIPTHNEEESMVDLEKRLSWSDKTMVESSSDGSNNSWEPSVSLADSGGEVDALKHVSVTEAYDQPDTMSRDLTSTSDSAELTLKGTENKSSSIRELKDDLFDKNVYEEIGHVLDNSNHSSESYGSAFGEEDDEIKEVDEGLLSELDSVGDFRVKEVVGETIHDVKMLRKPSDGSCEFDPVRRDSNPVLTGPEIPVLEFRSIEDIELAFKQLHEGVDIEEVILPSMIESQLVSDERDPGGAGSDFPTVEARSLEDIHAAMKQVSTGNIGELSETSYSNDGPLEVNEVSSVVELPILQVRTNDTVFEQIHEGTDIREAVLPSTIDHQLVVDASSEVGRISSDLPVFEARSLEDCDAATKQISETKFQEQPRSSQTKDEVLEETEFGSSQEIKSRIVEVNEVNYTTDAASNTLEVREVDYTKKSNPLVGEPLSGDGSVIASHESKQDSVVTTTNFSVKIVDTADEKVKSHGSNSDSSSGLSSGSSD